jgi:branched-subunit amino acid transport protein
MTRLLAPDRLLALSFLFTGAGLITHIVFGLSLVLSVALTFTGAAVFFLVLYQVGEVNNVNLRRVITGLLAGVVATAAYDATRSLIWKVFLSGVWPFEAFHHFGEGLLGQDISRGTAIFAGVGHGRGRVTGRY